jgi:hypothetical protein
MTALVWDQDTDRTFETGIDRGVLYPIGIGRPAVVWNGLTAVTETGSRDLKEYYYEGIKIFARVVPGAFSGKIEAVTYPDVMDEMAGVVSNSPGVRIHDSPFVI